METNSLKLRWLLVGEFFGSFGNSFIWPLTTIYIHNQLHQSLTISGIVLLLYSGTNIIGSSVSGNLFDRYNSKKMMLIGLVGAISIMGLLVLYNSWPFYPILLTAFGFFNGWIITILNSFGTQVSKQQSRYVFNMIYFTNNLGVVIGTMVVGPLYELFNNNVAPLFIITITMYLIYITIVQKHFVNTTSAHVSQSKQNTNRIKISGSSRYEVCTLFLSMAIIWIAYSQWSSNLSVYMTNKGISMTQYSLLWTINGLLIILFQTIINRVTKHVINDYWFVYSGILACGLSFVILIFANRYSIFVLGMIMLTLGEATVFPTIPTIVNKLSPKRSKGKYQGILNACISSGKASGPLLGGLLISSLSYQGLFIFCVISLVLVEILIIIMRSASKD